MCGKRDPLDGPTLLANVKPLGLGALSGAIGNSGATKVPTIPSAVLVRPPAPPPPPPYVALNISRETAETLLAIIEHVGGPTDGPRGDIDALRGVLLVALGKSSAELADQLINYAAGKFPQIMLK